ncbi:universal stress protein [Pontibacter chinhatensis]|uniref:Nucleotide-binding universal stress protein, UspA family n=1 Tax=Pontibacter chinhatensis TaxID=1436961 RepID=A0A1I2MDD8_9BACT|nr:universal stress protein [Pontibacter chinhatensis]SFF89504.1 Nucleotide-binding universal stress protein, UspA family [Pontibacter chinhatensis]
MNTINRLMVGLDLTAMDDSMVAYAAFLCRELHIQNVYFIHVEKSLEVPAELVKSLERTGLSVDEGIREMIMNKVGPAFQDLPDTFVEALVEEGTPLKELLHWAKVKEIDLLLMGRKLRLRGTAVLAQKVLRTSRRSVLFVPENIEPKLRNVVVSVDFSDYSTMALERVLQVAEQKPDIRVTCLHAYQVPSGYRTLGMSYEEFDERMRGFAEEKYKKLMERFPQLSERASLSLVRQEDDDDIGELVVVEAKRHRADLLVIGAKGMSAAALFVLGSVTEKILRYDLDIPLLVFKKRDEDLGFLDALLSE